MGAPLAAPGSRTEPGDLSHMMMFDDLGFLWGAFLGALIGIAYELQNQDD